MEVVTANGNVTLGSSAAAAGVNRVLLGAALTTTDATAFAGALTVDGTSGVDTVNLNAARTGAKALNLGAGADDVNLTTTGVAAGGLQVNFTSGSVGNSTNNNVTVVNTNGNIVVNDEGTRLIASTADAFNVVGLAADGTVDTAQNRGNFRTVVLGTADNDTLSTATAGNLGNVYINAGFGDDAVTGNAAASARHLLVGGDGNDTFTVDTAAGDSSVVVIGGAGDDSVTVGGTAHAGEVNVSLISGTNTVTFTTGLTLNTATAANNDTLTGGSGRDTLAATSAELVAVTAAAAAVNQSISAFEALRTTNGFGVDATAATTVTLTTRNIQAGIDTVTLAGVQSSDNAAVAAAARVISFDAGVNATLNLSAASGPNADVNFTVTNNGTAATESLTIANTATTGNIFVATNDVVVTNYETVNINSGTYTTAAAQALGTLNITGSGTNPAIAVNVSGGNAMSLGAITAAGTGALTISAANLTAQATGTTFTLAAPARAANITGSAGSDNITLGAFNNTVAGGAGSDTVTASTGNDNINGGTGNDRILFAAAALTSADTVVGGDNTDTLVINAAVTAANASGVSGFEQLAVATQGVSVDLFNFAANNSIATLEVANDLSNGGAASSVAFTNASSAANSLVISAAPGAAGTVDFSRLVNGTADTLAISRSVDANVVLGGITVNNEETLTISSAATTAGRALSTTGLNAIQATSITISGNGATSITVGTAAAAAGFGLSTTAKTVTVAAAASTGAVVFNAAGNTNTAVSLNITGSSTAQNTLTGGSGADVITGGAVADTIAGGRGADRIVLTAGGTDTVFQGTLESQQISTVAIAGGLVTAFTFGSADQITGFGNGDLIDLGNGDLDVTGDLVQTNSNTFSVADDKGVYIRGTYNATAGTFSFSATGSDTVVIFDADEAGTFDVQAVLLIGFSGTIVETSGTSNGVYTGVVA